MGQALDMSVVGASCTSPPPPPTNPNYLEVSYQGGSWLTIQCGAAPTNVTQGQPPIFITGTDQGGVNRLPVTCTANTQGGEPPTTLTYASGTWQATAPAPQANCQSSLANGVPFTLCTIKFSAQAKSSPPIAKKVAANNSLTKPSHTG